MELATAVTRSAIETGLPVMALMETGSAGHELLDLTDHAGLAPHRMILGHRDPRLDHRDLAGLAGRGAWISFGHIGEAGFVSDRQRAELAMRLADEGFGTSLLLSQGLSGVDGFVTSGGGPGWIHLLERFTIDLMEAGATADLVRTMLVDNPARALAIQMPAP